MIPESQAIGYECVNGHVYSTHKQQPDGHDGPKAVCRKCKATIRRTLIPLYQCADCDHLWPYTGDADRPTCPECKGKRTSPVDD